MIAINLLPISVFKQKLKGRIFMTAFALLTVVGLAGILSIKFLIFDVNIRDLQSKTVQLNNELSTYKTRVTQATQTSTETVARWKQLAAIIDIEERRRDQARLLAEIERLVPKDSAWLMNLNHNKNGVLVLAGAAKDKDTISQFLTNLQNSTYLDRYSVYPGAMSQDMRINNLVMTKFTITAQSKFPEPQILKSGMEQFKLPSTETFVETVKKASSKMAEGLADD